MTYEPLLAFVDAAIQLTGADFGNLQIVHSTGDLEIVAQRGFSEEWLSYWNTHARGKGCCGSALENGHRVVVQDITKSEIFSDAEALEIQLREGVWAIQSTPIFAEDGRAVGMLSTHYRKPWKLTAGEIASLDVIARKASHVIEISFSNS